jgi:hypothetical protein
MFEVTEYRHPHIFVTSRRTGETYRFLVEDNGALANDAVRFDPDEARRKATEYLFRKGRESSRVAAALS